MTMRPSTWVLIIANLFPLIGVALFGWNILAVLLLYWTESVIVGGVNVFRMALAQSTRTQVKAVDVTSPVPENQVGPDGHILMSHSFKAVMIPFFIVHYGGFCWGHASLVVAIFGPGSGLNPQVGATLAELWQGPFLIAVVAIFVSHLFSLVWN